ncbi:MAG: hypothetical protein VX460_00830 [Planctomycetota bacterium]|nr:hypothetical protein [Planctomycetota bacterium]
MSGPTLQIKAGGRTRTIALRAGLTRIAGPGTRGVDVELEGAAGELHVWDSPPKVVRVRGEDALVADGAMVEELELADGIGFAWCGAKFRYRGAAVLEEIVTPEREGPAPDHAATAPGFDGTDALLFKRVAAGLLVETGLADKKTIKRWQGAVLQQSWDADACAEEILSHPGARAALSDPRVLNRADRLERDFLMASLQRGIRGASRRVRGAARNTTAFFVANVIAILVYSAIILALLIVARVGYDWSLDEIVDRMTAVLPGSAGE